MNKKSSIIGRYAQLKKTLQAKRQKLELQDAKTNNHRLTSSSSKFKETNNTVNEIPSDDTDLWSLRTQPVNDSDTISLDLYSFNDDYSFDSKVAQLSFAICGTNDSLIVAFITSQHNININLLVKGKESVILWSRMYEHNTAEPIAIHTLAMPSENSENFQVGVSVLFYDAKTELLSLQLIIGTLKVSSYKWNLVDVLSLPLSSEAYVSPSCIFASMISTYFEDVGYILTIIVPNLALLTSCQISLGLKRFLCKQTKSSVCSFPARINFAKICETCLNDCNDLIVFLGLEGNLAIIILYLTYIFKEKAYKISNLVNVHISEYQMNSISNFSIFPTCPPLLVKLDDKPTHSLTFLATGLDTTSSRMHDYLGFLTIFSDDSPKLSTLTLRLIAPTTDLKNHTWGIFWEHICPMRQLLVKFQLDCKTGGQRLLFWPIADYLKCADLDLQPVTKYINCSKRETSSFVLVVTQSLHQELAFSSSFLRLSSSQSSVLFIVL